MCLKKKKHRERHEQRIKLLGDLPISLIGISAEHIHKICKVSSMLQWWDNLNKTLLCTLEKMENIASEEEL